MQRRSGRLHHGPGLPGRAGEVTDESAASSDPPAWSAKRPPMMIYFCHHRIRVRRPFRPVQVCFRQRRSLSRVGNKHRTGRIENKDCRIDSDGCRSRRSDSSSAQNYQTDGSRVTRPCRQELTVSFELSQTQHRDALGRVPTTPLHTHLCRVV